MKVTSIITKGLGAVLLAVGLFCESSLGQSGLSNARSAAMAGAYSALARGVQAPAWNPANLGLSSERPFTINLVSFGLGLYNNAFSKKHYDLYNGKYLTAEDKANILALIPADGLRADFDTEAQILGLSFGRYAFTVSGVASSDLTFSRDLADLLLNGNELDRVYEIGNSDGDGWAVTSFAVSVGFPLTVPIFQEFAVGASLKYLRGLGYGEVQEAYTNVRTTIEGLEGDGRFVVDFAEGGSGLAIDLGAAARLNDTWSLSFSLKDVVNYVNWSTDPQRFVYAFVLDSLTAERAESSDLDSLFRDTDETVDIDPFSSALPRKMRIGVARTTGMITLAVDYVQGFRTAAGTSATPLLAAGGELRALPWLPLRGGLALGGKEGFSTALGFGVDVGLMAWNFGATAKGGVFSGRGLGLAFDWLLRL